MPRGYTVLDESGPEIDDVRAAALMRRWSAIHDAREAKSFRLQALYEDGYDETPRREQREHEVAQQADEDLEVAWIEEQLASCNARPMRPYEHWHEDERLMEYSERERY